MNSSGSEFALRIALCDLIERLKRCEHKCSYLEQCRNELIKEVMRLRLENQWLSTCREHTLTDTNQMIIHSNNSIHNNNNCISSFNNNVIMRSVNELKDETKNLVEYDLIGNNLENRVYSNAEESWEEITVRLLSDLRRDVANGEVLNGQQTYGLEICAELNQNNSSNAIIDKIETNGLHNHYETNDRHLNSNHNNSNKTIVRNSVFPINGELNQLNDKSLDKNVMSANNTRQQINQIKKMTSITNETNLCGFHDYNSSYLSQINENKKLKNINNDCDDKECECDAQTFEPTNTALSNFFQTNPIDNNNSECINAFCSAIYYVKKDLNQVLQAITAQNDKLNRLKAKQLRSYFQRQINLDQAIHQTNTPLSHKIDQKSNHENY